MESIRKICWVTIAISISIFSLEIKDVGIKIITCHTKILFSCLYIWLIFGIISNVDILTKKRRITKESCRHVCLKIAFCHFDGNIFRLSLIYAIGATYFIRKIICVPLYKITSAIPFKDYWRIISIIKISYNKGKCSGIRINVLDAYLYLIVCSITVGYSQYPKQFSHGKILGTIRKDIGNNPRRLSITESRLK